MNELIEKVEQWAIDRNLHTASPQGQALKVVEEFTEALMAHEDDDMDEVIDGIGDTYVTLIILCKQLGIDFLSNFPENCSDEPAHTASDIVSLGFIGESLNWLVSGVAKGDDYLTGVGITMILITLKQLTEIYKLTPIECLSVAYNEIKDRKGKMIDGVFVKESDL